MFWTKDRTDEILRRHLDRDFWVTGAGANPPAKKQLTAVAERHGCKLPKDFLAHSTGTLGGLYVEVKEDVWPRAEPYAVAPFWTFLYAVFTYGLSPEIPEWMNLELAAAEFVNTTGHQRVPCLKVVGDADLYVFDHNGDIAQWRHETDEFEPFQGSFFELLDREVARLRERKDRKVAGEP
ncbi:MAG TPA: hypothetical protein VJZ00_17205 [Thermoanaerobaculia bacterium]|nr:hypothetical protein [Thermoanaerobaculia bacterium]